MFARNSSLVVALVLLVSIQPNAQENKQLSMYAQSQRNVIRLEFLDPRDAHYKPVGTAFFVKDEANMFIVTAGHVAKVPGDLRARVPILNEETGQVRVFELRLPHSRWVFHPETGSATTHPVDVASMKLPNTFPEKGKWRSVSFRYCTSKCPDGAPNQLGEDPEPPSTVLVFGFPGDLGFQLKSPRPMARQGLIALAAEEEFIFVDYGTGEQKYAERRAILIDTKAFPGNSGSPIFLVGPLDGSVGLAGLIISTRPFDYAVAEPVSRIRETIDRAKKENNNFEAWFRLEN